MSGFVKPNDINQIAYVNSEVVQQQIGELTKGKDILQKVSNFFTKCHLLAADQESQETLLIKTGLAALAGEKLSGNVEKTLAERFLGKGEKVTITLRLNDKLIKVNYPNDANTLMFINEALLNPDDGWMKNFSKLPKVNKIYEVGANIGLQTLRFYTLFPETKIICIEPAAENLSYLRENLTANQIPSQVLPIMLGKEKGETSLNIYDKSFHFAFNTVDMTNVVGEVKEVVQISTSTYDEIITGKDYGLSINISGGEHVLVNFPEVLKNASWVVGAIFYSDFTPEENPMGYENLLNQFFDIDYPEVIILPGGNVFVKYFTGIRKS